MTILVAEATSASVSETVILHPVCTSEIHPLTLVLVAPNSFFHYFISPLFIPPISPTAHLNMALPGTETIRFRRPTAGPNAVQPKEEKKDEFGSLAPQGWKRRHQGLLQDQVGR